MSATIDLTDVPEAAAADLDYILRSLIANGQGLVLLKGLSQDEWKIVDELIWTAGWSAERRLTATLRFRSLVAAFGARRLQNRLLYGGLAVMRAGVRAAAYLRLNARRGFTPQSMLAGISRELSRDRAAIPEAFWMSEPMAA